MRRSHYNIAHILPWPSVGGTEQATLRIAQAVEGDQWRNIAFHLHEATAVRDLFAAAGFETIGYSAIEPSYRHPHSFVRDSLKLAKEIRRREIDLVHCSDTLAGQCVALAGKLARRPVICHVRNRNKDVSRRDQIPLHLVDQFVFVSQDTWKNFAFSVSAGRGTVIYDGIDASEVDDAARQSVHGEFNVSAEVRIIGMVARVAPQKDFKTLIKAARQIVAVTPQVRFLIVGDHSGAETLREHYGEVKQMLAENDVAPYFIFTDYRSDVSKMISAMDVFVLSTHHEGLPLVILEAMAQGKPVVATAVDGIPEIVFDGKTGLLHRHQDDRELAAQILSLLQDEEQAMRLGEAGRQLVKTDFSREQFAANMRHFYRNMLGLNEDAIRTTPLPRRAY